MWGQGTEPGKVCSAVGGPGQLLPGNGDLIALKNGNGGYIGGVKGNDRLLIVPHCQGWEHFYFESVDNSRFALKQKESGNYIGGNANHGEQPFLANARQQCEILTYSILSNGMVTILNSKNSKLSKNGDKLFWSNQTTLSESWNFEMIQKSNNTSSTGVNINTNIVPSTGNIPPSGSVVSIENRQGGFIGKVREKGAKLKISPKSQDWEKFIIESKGNNRWTFKQKVSGLYLGGAATNNGEQLVLTQSCQGGETFEIVPRDGGLFNIRSDDRKVVMQKFGDSGVVWSHGDGVEEQWRLVPDNVPVAGTNNQMGVNNQMGANQNWGQNQNNNWGQPNQGQQGWNQGQVWGQGQQPAGWNQAQQGVWGQGPQPVGWNQGQQSGWGQGQGQGQGQGNWNQQQGWNQGQQGGFVPDFLNNVQQHMHQSGNQGNHGNPYQQQGNPFNSFQGGFSG